ncbi:class I tRNA ligase family protein [uncultured Methylobacterium sp.]|uniref:class I tRNA ligase family protein n=1 Tax=uncultured Methylobacterium sp. TaxID=157278 RepID=UPI002599E0CC|nr:class I tRNA ligase family protein [uncultured Methylobacterium sp.]
MQIIRLADQTFGDAFGIRMAAIPLGAGGAGPGAAYGVIGPGGESRLHRHDESEAFLILSGRGQAVPGDGPPLDVAAGDVVIVDPFDSHVLRTVGEEPLVFLDLYWRDPARAAGEAGLYAARGLANRPVFVFSTPPTPNGDLHLGHLSGPYLGADAFTRFQRMLGNEVYHLTGSDDFQSYVVAKARQLASDPPAVAARFAQEIRETLAMMDIEPDQFTVTSHAPGYATGLRDFYARVLASGVAGPRATPATFDPRSGDYLYEPDISGRCPACAAACGGNICEECGSPNFCVDLIDARSALSGEAPVVRDLVRHVLPLRDLETQVRRHLAAGKAAPRLHALVERVFSRTDLDVPISHPQAWGIAPESPAGPGQVIWVWPEMAYGFLYGIEAVARHQSRPWRAAAPDDSWKIVHFFGYDNSFYHTILYPALYSLAYPGWNPDIDYHVNEFYLLEGKKFSTSRRHAVWGKEVLSPGTVDAVRYHLSLTRGEVARADFDRDALERTRTSILARWDAWLDGLGGRLAGEFGGAAPDAGDWSADHRAFLAQLERRRGNLEAALAHDGFSLNRAASELDALVGDAVRFARSEGSVAGIAAMRDRDRTAVALQLAAARLLAAAAAPIMPRFAWALAAALGEGPPERWLREVTLVEPGRRIRLGEAPFFAEAFAPARAA